MKLSIRKELLAQAIARDVAECIDLGDCTDKIECGAVHILEQIRDILDDDGLSDPECLGKIDAIVSVFHSHGLYTSRHDFG